MKIWQLVAVGFGLVCLSGCDVSGLSIDSRGGGAELQLDEVQIEREALTSNLAMMTKDNSIRIGQKLNTILVGGYRKPPRGVTLKELPPGFSPEFTGLGWETPERTVSLVAREDDVFFGLDMVNAAKGSMRDDVVSRYKFIYGSPYAEVEGSGSGYWFWSDGPVRLMVCAVKVGGDDYRLTTVLGLGTAMDRLRMDPDSAKRDIAAAAQIAAENQPK